MSDETWTYSNEISGRVDGPVVQIGSARIENLTLSVAERSAPVPRQLPPADWVFVNRVEELRQITRWTESSRGSGGALVVLAHGAPGMGKSRLMLQWAALNRHRYPDGQVMVDLASMRRDGIVDLSDVLGSVLRSIDFGVRPLPDDLAGRRALYRTWAADKRLLVVIDDADLDEQVESLVPDSRAATVLVSSRNVLGRSRISGAPLVNLVPLTAESIRALVGRYCTDALIDDKDIRVVIDASGGLPLAAIICATRLSESTPGERRRLLSRLADPAQRVAAMSDEHTGLATILDEAIEALPSELRSRFLFLALFPGPAPSIGALAALWDIDEGEADDTIGGFRRRCLVEVVGDRVRVHGLVLSHIRQRAFDEVPAEAQLDALRRLTVWARRLAQGLDASLGSRRLRLAPQQPVDLGEVGGDEVFTQFEDDRTNLMAVVGEATRAGLEHEAWPIGEALWPLFHGHGHDREALELFTACAEAAERAGNRPAQARLLAQVAYTRLNLGDAVGAARGIESAVRQLGLEGPPALHAALSEWRGVIERERGNYKAARTHVQTARTRFLELGDRRGAAVCDYLLGGILRLDGDEEAGSRRLERALVDIDRVDDRLIWVRVAMACGRSRLARGYAREAADLASMCRAQASENGVPIAFALAVQLSAECAVALDQPDEAAGWYAAARDLYGQLGDPREAEASAALSALTSATATNLEGPNDAGPLQNRGR